MKQFKNRLHAGELLARRLSAYVKRADVIVLALPRGGVPVGFAVAKQLKVPLDILLVHKLGLPGNEAIAMGAISSEGVCVLKPEFITSFDIPPEIIEALAHRECREMKRQERLYRGGRSSVQLSGRLVIVVDDGLDTGATMQAAVRALRHHHPSKIIAALPVAQAQNCDELQAEVDDLICLRTPEYFSSVGKWYENFSQISDLEVKDFLTQAKQWHVPEKTRTISSHQMAR